MEAELTNIVPNSKLKTKLINIDKEQKKHPNQYLELSNSKIEEDLVRERNKSKKKEF